MEGLGGATGAALWAGRGRGEERRCGRGEGGAGSGRGRGFAARAVETAACASGDPGGVASEGPVRPGLLAFRGN